MSKQRDVMQALADARPGRLDPGTGRRPDPTTIMATARHPDRDPAHPAQHPGLKPAHVVRRPDLESARRIGGGPVGAGRRPTRRLVLAGLVPTVAVAAVGAIVVTSGGEQSEVGPRAEGLPSASVTAVAPAPRTARALFLVAAERTAASAAAGGRYWMVSTEHGERRRKGPASRPYDIMLRHVDEQWQATRAGDESVFAGQYLGSTPVTAADQAAWRADGSPQEWVEQPPSDLPDAKQVVVKAAGEPKYRRPIDDPTGRTTYAFAGTSYTVAQLMALPTEPRALRAWLKKALAGSMEPDDYSLFWSGRHLIFDLPVTAGTRAAAYRMLAEVKGVTFLGPAADQRGRAGLAVAYTRKGDGGTWSQTRLIIDPATGRALAEESWNLGKNRSGGGALTSYSLLLRAGFSDGPAPTDLPTHP